jgi:hypothetical protein
MLNKQDLAAVLLGELDSAIRQARAGDDGRTALALRYYDGELPANDDKNEDPHRAAVSLDVADMVEATFAQMAPALEDVGGVEFEAASADDEPQAMRESQIVRTMLMDGYMGEGGFVSLTEAIKNALLTRKGVLALWIDRRETRTPETWENVPELAVGEIAMPTRPGQRVEGLQITPEAESEAEDQAEGEQEEAGPTYKVTLTRVDVEKRLCTGAVAPENFVTSSLDERDVNQARFVADRFVTTRARLIQQGFEAGEVAKLKQHDPSTYDLYVKRSPSDETAPRDAQQASTQLVEVWRCYAMLGSTKESPDAERYRVYFSRDSRVVLGEPEKVGRVCYAVGNVVLYPHRLDGVSMFDKIGEVQELKSRALRSWDENLHKVNRPRLAVDENLANLGDVQDATIDAIRVKGPNAVTAIPIVDAGPSMLGFLQYQDQARSERGGASLDMQSASMQLASNQTAQGIERQYSVKEQLAAAMARTFAETCLRSAYQIAHYLLRTQWGGELNAKLGGQWATEDPSKWQASTGVVVRVGQSASERMRKALALGQVMQAQVAMMQQGKGGILVDDGRIYNAAYDWIAATQLRSPERYLIDPASPGAQEAAKRQERQQQLSMIAQGDAARAALMLEKYKVDVGALTDLVGELVKAAVEEAKLTLSTAPLDEAQAITGAAAAGAAQSAKADEAAGAPQQGAPA